MVQAFFTAAGTIEDASDPGLLPVIAAIVMGLPMAGVLAFFIWVKIRDRDDPLGPVLRPSAKDPEDGDDDDGGGSGRRGPEAPDESGEGLGDV